MAYSATESVEYFGILVTIILFSLQYFKSIQSKAVVARHIPFRFLILLK